MSSDEAVFESDLEDLENFAELLSPTSAQSRETRIVDSARRIGFDESRELVISVAGVHTENTVGLRYLWSVLVTFPKWSLNLPDYKL